MGWWIFKSAKEKALDKIGKRLANLEHILFEEEEDELLAHLDSRLDRIEKAMYEPETPEPPAPGSAPATPQGLVDQTAIAQQLWAKVPPWIKPIVNNLAKARLGKSVDELMQDSDELQKTLTGLGQAVSGIVSAGMNKMAPGQQQMPGNLPFGRIPEEMPQLTEFGKRLQGSENGEKKKSTGALVS
jgi:hypothetical protein